MLMSPMLILLVIVVLYLISSIKILAEYERGVIFRLGKLLPQPKGPGVVLVFAPIDRIVTVSLRTVVLDVPPKVCQERNRERPDRQFGPHVTLNQSRELRRGLKDLKREGFSHAYVLDGEGDVDRAVIERVPLWTDLRRERGPFDPLAYLSGSVEVVATGRVEGSNREGLIRYESATVAGVAVPKTVAQELLRFYTSTPERPRGFAFDEPFELPAGFRAATVERGAVTVTQ